MYIILVYDVNEKRCQKVLKTCRKYLNHIQNSVLEGEISDSQLFKLKKEINNLINEEEGDSIIIFKSREEKWLNREILGCEKRSIDNIL
jgi:CRISPR-associated protein Cas2